MEKLAPAEFNTPVVLFIFNREDTTQRVMEVISGIRPARLLIVADGPRTEHKDDMEACRRTREAARGTGWTCEVSHNFSAVNMGVSQRFETGLDWVFSLVDEAIILEDDCLPDASFFRYCAELLERYRDDERIMMIGGDQFGPVQSGPDSYSFIRYIGIWGWATWARSWRHRDLQLKAWPKLRGTGWLEDLLGDSKAAAFWTYMFDYVAQGKYPAWDYPWMFSCWAQNGLSIMPSRNLVSNIGFGAAATNTKESNASCENLPICEMAFPLRHPELMIRNREADRYWSKNIFRCYRWLHGGRIHRWVIRLCGFVTTYRSPHNSIHKSVSGQIQPDTAGQE